MPIMRYLRALKRTLSAIARTGRPPLPGKIRTRPNGQVVVAVYPTNMYERLTLPGTTVEVRMEPGVAPRQVASLQAPAYSQPAPEGKVCLVLGAGNVSGIPFNDALTKLFVDGFVVLLKMNPVNEYLGPMIETACAPLISQGYMRIVYGGPGEGSYLTNHPGIDSIHITGSDRTYEAILFGTGPDAERRKAARAPLCTKPISCELGNIAPAIIVPGPWSGPDLQYQAQQLAANLCDGGSYSCSRTRVIVQHAGWPLADRLLVELQSVLSQVRPMLAYYPGATDLYDRFMAAHPQAVPCGSAEEHALPWTLVPDVDPSNRSDICFTTESFCPIMASTRLEAASPADFVSRAVDFANDTLWGTLTAVIIVHPDSLRDPVLRDAVEDAVQRLRYGVVAINCLPGLVWGLAVPPWGSFPGNEPWDIQSGTGFVNNAYMFTRVQKTVLRGPFRSWPLPPWFPSKAASMAEVCRRVADYEAQPSLARMVRVVAAALR